MQPLSGNQRPDLRTSLMNMSFVLRLPREMHLCRSSSNVPRLPSFLEMLQNPHVFLTFDKVHNPFCLPRKNGIWTSKSAPYPSVLCTFDFEMCFPPQRRALFRHQLPKVVRRWGALYILTSKCASRHNGVQFFISHLASWLRTRRFSEPTFRPSGASNQWKNTVFRDFPTFSRICIFFLLTLSLLWSSLFYSPLLSASAQLCFSSVHIVGSLTSKLPSINYCIFPAFWTQNVVKLGKSIRCPERALLLRRFWEIRACDDVIVISTIYKKQIRYCLFSSWSPGISCTYPAPRPKVWCPMMSNSETCLPWILAFISPTMKHGCSQHALHIGGSVNPKSCFFSSFGLPLCGAYKFIM